MEIILNIGILAIGFLMLIKGADWLVSGASGIANKLGIPSLVIGLTIVAMGTSAPEAAVSITSAFKHSADIAIGNVLGSNIMNILVILGITSIITPLALKKNTINYEIPFLIAISIILPVLGLRKQKLVLTDGIILTVLFIAYLSYLFFMTKNGLIEEEDEGPIQERNIAVLLLMTVVGIAVVVIGSNFAVDGASNIARILGVSERVIGLTIVALGTSLPELVTSLTAAKKGSADIAIGNIVGSNIFNILFILGLSSLITPIAYQSQFFVDSIMAIAATVILALLVLNKDHKLKRYGGIAMLVVYSIYLIYLLK